MTVFYKLALLATAALVAMAAPIDTSAQLRRHTTATVIPESEGDLVTDASVSALSSTSGSSSGSFSGRGTWFTDTVGSCGKPFQTSDMIVAMNAAQMGGTSQCGRQVQITANGKTVSATVVDTCPSQFCSSGSLDLSQAVFKQLAPLDQGVVHITWKFA
ncbi:hypothetical protein EDD11_001780 [Mortierella claussenii]|nr:hypothetical protein EDD11_001780 [Mortierella claussenii]